MLCKWIVDFIHNLLPLNAGKEVLVTTQRKIYNLLSRRATDHNFHLLMKCRHAFDFSRPCSSPRRWMGRRCRLRMVESTSGMTSGRTIRKAHSSRWSVTARELDPADPAVVAHGCIHPKGQVRSSTTLPGDVVLLEGLGSVTAGTRDLPRRLGLRLLENGLYLPFTRTAEITRELDCRS